MATVSGDGNTNGGKNANARRLAIEAAASVLALLVQEERGSDHFRILIAVDYPDCRLEIIGLTKWKLTA